MGFFDWLFGTDDPPDEGERSGEMVELPTGGGETTMVSRQRYRDEILPDQIAQAGGDPEQLFQTVRLAVDKGLAEAALQPARRLRELDADPERSATLLGLVYWKMGRLERAEATYRAHLEEHGDSGVVLLNLAKVYDQRGEQERARATLREAIEVRPNLEPAVDWWASMHAERADERQAGEAYRRALREVADLSEAWYAQARLAHLHLERGEDERGLALARKVATEFGGTERVMMLLTGPLGEAGHLEEMIELFAERYEATEHSPLVGLNLVHACLETGCVELGLELCEALAGEETPEIREPLERARQALEEA